MKDTPSEIIYEGTHYKGNRRLVGEEKGAVYVPVSHEEIGNLIGRLMQMCDLLGDVEQRRALKSTIKQITREWLDSEYDLLGYDKWAGIREGVPVVAIDK